ATAPPPVRLYTAAPPPPPPPPMTRPAPSSTLFPYTTLFRSRHEDGVHVGMLIRRIREEVQVLDANVAVQRAEPLSGPAAQMLGRSEEHTSELQSREKLVCRLLLEKKNQ